MPTLFAHVPAAVVENLSWKTNIRSGQTGEVRDSFRDATQYLSLGYRAVGAKGTAIRGQYRTNIAGEFYLPLWMDMDRLGSVLSIGATSVAVGVGDYAVGGKAVVIGSGPPEILDVTSWDGTTLGFTATTLEHSQGAFIVPLGVFIVPEGVDSAASFVIDEVTLTFLRTDGRDLGASAFGTLSGLAVWSDPSTVVSPLSGGVRQALELLSSAFGAYGLMPKEVYPRERLSLRFSERDRAGRWARRQFLHFLRGKDRPFWLSTRRHDVILSDAASGAALTVNVDVFGDATVHASLIGQYLEFYTESAVSRRLVTGTSEIGGGKVQLTLSTTLGITAPIGTRVSLLRKFRMDNDEVALDHAFVGGSDFITSVGVNVVEVVG